MTTKRTLAAVQMDAAPAPTTARLERAEKLVDSAAARGAELVVLPELFNIGYSYSPANYYRAEPITGPTTAWLAQTAARLNIHLAGSLLLRDGNEIYNSLLLFAPDGRRWRYDKIYPWGWERAYFRGGKSITIAKTDLGRIGLLICWDIGHSNLWLRYAGRVDLMLVASCPPLLDEAVLHAPDGYTFGFEQLGIGPTRVAGTVAHVFGPMLNEHIAWLGVPAVNTVGSGRFRSTVPNATASLINTAVLAPHLLKYLPQAQQMELEGGYAPECKILDRHGQVVSQVASREGDDVAVGTVAVGAMPPLPNGLQPANQIKRFVYLISDKILPWLTTATYRRGIREAWGPQMAPVDPARRRWSIALALFILAGVLVGLFVGRRK